MKFIIKSSFFVLFLLSNQAFSTEYVFRDLMANTLPSFKCEAPEDAIKTAEKPYKYRIYSKKFCQTQGYGWHIDKVKQNGKVACNDCTNTKGLQKCFMKDVVVTCKRIKPGTVGMLPGKG